MAFLVASVISEFCVTVQRLHDLDRSGWQYWRLSIPFYNLYLGFILLFRKGTKGPNQYGDDPLQKEVVSALVEAGMSV